MMVMKAKKHMAQKCVIKQKLNFEDSENYLKATQPENKISKLKRK